MANFISHEFELPTHWAPYLINGDEDSLTLSEINIVDAFVKETGLVPLSQSERKHSSLSITMHKTMECLRLTVPPIHF